ncbi:SMI1/KNR4 family protein [Streptomyces sp. PA03-5A]|nr:SMI1/KNR4 family protein [Streptomyces sp. PA03-5A]
MIDGSERSEAPPSQLPPPADEVTMNEHLRAVIDMLGPPEDRFADPSAWLRLETELGLALPSDYKKIIDSYAPVIVNAHLYLNHPATEWWNLSQWMRETITAFTDVDWDGLDLDPDEDPRELFGLPELTFGTMAGLWPIASTDRGEYVFLVRGPGEEDERLIVVDGDLWWAEHRVSFAEWLHRYLIGEDMTGPNSSAFYPGPVRLEHLPMAPDERPRPWFGPDRGM